MRFALTPDHRHFFEKNHWIEFDGLFSENEIQELYQESEKAIQIRLKKEKLDSFILGRDIWRDAPAAKKIIGRQKIGEIASALFNIRPLRLAYDQYFPGPWEPTAPYSLEMVSCFKPLVGALLLELTGTGKIIFFLPDLTIPSVVSPSYMLVYSQDKTRYIEEKRDVHRHALKKMGYVYGDQLTSETHPILYR